MTEPEPGTSRLREQLEELILREEPGLTAQQVADSAEVSLEEARRLWRALGFPDAEGQTAFTEDDVRALRLLTQVRAGGLDDDSIVRMTRAVGSTLSRLADWEVDTLAPAFDTESNEAEERLTSAIELLDRIAPSFEALLVYAWRRHLAAAVARAAPLQAAEESHLADATVGFADLVGFTALSNDLDEAAIGDLVEVFETRCHDVVAEHRGRVIKSLGDSVLFVSDDVVDGLDIGLDIIGVIGGDGRLPDVRVGVATGPAVLRMGDVFGPAVNLAARLTTVARRNRLIVDGTTAERLPGRQFETRRLPARPLRGFGDVVPIAVRRTRPRHAGE